MATNITPTTLGNLEFADIKKSLSDFLKTQSVFSGYNFEGSAMQTIIDMLAYNTFYYAYYANMINAEAFLDSAQKEDSIISLVKPLGYTVPSRTAAKAKVIVGGITTNTVPVGTVFTSTNANGIQYNFYVIGEDKPVVEEDTGEIYIYEGTQFINKLDVLSNFDYELQRIAIADTNFDLSTLKVYVTEKIGDSEETITNEWTKVQNIGYVSQINEDIYFVERTSTGFIIQFSIGNEIGRIIDDSVTKIEISYLKTNGSAGNGIQIFRNVDTSLGTNVIVQTIESSSGGLDKPTLNFVRNLAPKWFASQERAVTVNDYKALLMEAGYFQNEQEFNVFGGQDLIPPRYGRVFISSYLVEDDPKIAELINFIKERSVITVLPEYVISNSINVYTDFGYRSNTTIQQDSNYILSALKSIFKAKYAEFGKYNINFSASEFTTDIKSNTDYDPRVRNITITPDDFTIYLKETLIPNKSYTFNLQNEFDLPTNSYVNITESFTIDFELRSLYNIPNTSRGIIKMYITSLSQLTQPVNLQFWEITQDGREVYNPYINCGYFNAYKGFLNIKNKIIGSQTDLTINFAKKNIKIGLDNVVTFNYNIITPR